MLANLHLQLCRTLVQAKEEVSKLVESLRVSLAAARRSQLPALHPWLRAFALAAFASARAHALLARDWQAAEAAACGNALQAFVTLGALVGLAAVVGPEGAGALGEWLGDGSTDPDSWQALLSQQVGTGSACLGTAALL